MMFSRFLGGRGDVQLADDRDTLFRCLNRALADRASFLIGSRPRRGDIGDPAVSTSRLADLLAASAIRP